MKIKNRKTLIIISLLLYATILFTYNLGNAMMPLFLKETEFGTKIFGYLTGFMYLGQFLISPLWGRLSDRVGRWVLALSPLGYGVGQVLYVLSAHSLGLLIFSRVFSGVFAILFLSQFVAFISDVSPDSSRKTILSLTAIMVPLGSGFAYLIGGILKSDNMLPLLASVREKLAFLGPEMSQQLTKTYTFPFLLQLLLGIILAILAFLLVYNNNQYQVFHHKEEDTDENIGHQLFLLKKYAGTLVLPIIGISFFNSLAYSATQSIQYFLQDGLQLETSSIGLVVFVYSIASVIISLVIQPIFLKRFSTWKIMLISNATVIILALILGFSNVAMLIVCMSFIVVMNTLLVSSVQEVLVKESLKDRGVLLGVNQSAISFGSILGNFLVSPLYAFAPTIFNYRLPFVMMAIILVIVSLIIWFPLKKKL